MSEFAEVQEQQDKHRRKPRLLIATTVPATISAFLLPYADYFRGQDWRVDAMARDISRVPELASHFDKLHDVAWGRNPLAPKNLICTPQKIRDLVQTEEYDIVHVHTPVAAFVTRYALRHFRQKDTPKIVYTAHGFHFYKGGKPLKNFIFRNLEKKAGPWTDNLIVINEEDFDAAKKYGVVPEEQLVYMPGIGLDFSKYSSENADDCDTQKLRSDIGLMRGDVLFTMIAEFIPRKRHKDAIAALALTGKSDIHLAFAGTGPLLDDMKKLASRLGVQKQTHFLGFRNDIPAVLKASRASILSSGQEGLARALMESVCLGVPIIGADARGIREIVQPGRGLLYPVGDSIALRDAMLQMYEEAWPPVVPDASWDIQNLIQLHKKLYEKHFR